MKTHSITDTKALNRTNFNVEPFCSMIRRIFFMWMPHILEVLQLSKVQVLLIECGNWPGNGFIVRNVWIMNERTKHSAHCICARMLDFNRQPVDIAHLWNFFPLWMLNEAAKPLHAEHLLSWWTLSDGIIILFHKDLWIVLPFSFFTKVRIQGWEQKSQDFLKRSWLSLKKTNKKNSFSAVASECSQM